MSDYLGNLAARTLNETQVIQPRLASRFEPVQAQGALGLVQPAGIETEHGFNRERAVEPTLLPPSPIEKPASVPSAQRSRATLSAQMISPITPAQHAIKADETILPTPRLDYLDNQGATKRNEPYPAKPLGADKDDEPLWRKRPHALTDDAAPLMDEAAQTEAPAQRRPQVRRLSDEETRPATEPPWAREQHVQPKVQDGHGQAQLERPPMIEAPQTRVTSIREIERIVETIRAPRPDETDKREALAAHDGALPAHPAAEAGSLARPQPLTKVIAQPTVALAPPIQPAAPVATQSPRTEESAVAPTIQVTIGRIEVRATPPTPPPARKANAPHGMSLDDYLRARNGGSR